MPDELKRSHRTREPQSVSVQGACLLSMHPPCSALGGWRKWAYCRLWPWLGFAGQKTMQGKTENKPWHLQTIFTFSAELISGSVLLVNANRRQHLNHNLSHHTTACHNHQRSSGLRQAALLGRVQWQHTLNAHWYAAFRAVSETHTCRKGVAFLWARSHQPLVWKPL